MSHTTIFSPQIGVSGGREIARELEKGEETPSLVLLFPATLSSSVDGIRDMAKVLRERLDCTVLGASVGGFATEKTDGLETRGTVAVALPDVSFTSRRIENVWETDQETVQDITDWMVAADGPVLTCECGAREGGDNPAWKALHALARQIIRHDPLGQRKRLIQQLWSAMQRAQMGYPNMFLSRFRAGNRGQTDILNLSSGDFGRYTAGYEIWNENVTDSKSATMLALDTSFRHGQMYSAEESLESDRIICSFDELSSYDDIIYAFDGQTLADLKQVYPINQKIGRGGFSHYLLIETDDSVFSVPFSSELEVVISFVPIDADATAYLAHPPGFEEYKSWFQRIPDTGADETPHITITPAQVDSFRNHITDIVSVIDEQQDSYLFTVGTAFSRSREFEYHSPTYTIYS